MEPDKPTHLDEYKVVHDEITLYQGEMHRTWLWAIIPAGAVYTWLPTHTKDISIPWPVWFIPAVFFIICAGRWWTFESRIRVLVKYLLELEEFAFGNDKENKLPGIAHYNSKYAVGSEQPEAEKFVCRAKWVWGVLILGSLVLSVVGIFH
jgi:hypothetical protein